MSPFNGTIHEDLKVVISIWTEVVSITYIFLESGNPFQFHRTTSVFIRKQCNCTLKSSHHFDIIGNSTDINKFNIVLLHVWGAFVISSFSHNDQIAIISQHVKCTVSSPNLKTTVITFVNAHAISHYLQTSVLS